MALTAKEKAERYDALQAAIKFKAEHYESKMNEHQRIYENDQGILCAYNKGCADMCFAILDDLRRWIE